jgi:hypothetical protein
LPYDNILKHRPGWRMQHNHEVEVVEITVVNRNRPDTWWPKNFADLFEKPDIIIWNDWEQETPLLRTTLEERVDRYWRDRDPDLDPRDKNEKVEVQATYTRRRRWKTFTFLIGLVLFVGAMVLAGMQGAFNAADDWHVLAPAGEGFRALMPGEPQRRVDKKAGPLGVVQVTGYTAARRNGQFAIVFIERGRLNIPNQRLFEDWKKDLIADHPKARLRDDKAINLGGHPGREIVLQEADGRHIFERMYITPDRSFFLGVEGTLGPDHEDVRKFFNSFEIR